MKSYLFWLLAHTVQNFSLKPPVSSRSPFVAGAGAAGATGAAAAPFTTSMVFSGSSILRAKSVDAYEDFSHARRRFGGYVEITLVNQVNTCIYLQ